MLGWRGLAELMKSFRKMANYKRKLRGLFDRSWKRNSHWPVAVNLLLSTHTAASDTHCRHLKRASLWCLACKRKNGSLFFFFFKAFGTICADAARGVEGRFCHPLCGWTLSRTKKWGKLGAAERSPPGLGYGVKTDSLQGAADERLEPADHPEALSGAGQGELQQIYHICAETQHFKGTVRSTQTSFVPLQIFFYFFLFVTLKCFKTFFILHAE